MTNGVIVSALNAGIEIDNCIEFGDAMGEKDKIFGACGNLEPPAVHETKRSALVSWPIIALIEYLYNL